MTIDRYAYTSAWRNVHPTEKIVFALSMLILCVGASKIIVSLSVWLICTGMLVGWARIPVAVLGRFVALPLAFVLVAVLPILIDVSAEPREWLGAVRGFGLYWSVSQAGLHSAATVLCRSMGAVACMYLFAFTTPMSDFFTQLRVWRVPGLLVELMTLIYQFLFVMLDTAGQMVQAQILRLGYRNVRSSIQCGSSLFFLLFARSFARSRSMADALDCRLYDGKMNVLPRKYKRSTKMEAVFALVFLAILALAVWA